MNDPRIIILDEPTSGLDPRGMAEMREILKNLRNESKDLTIVMSSHILPEVQDLCDRIAMINHGNLLMDGDISKFTSISGARTMIVQTKDIPTDDLISRIGSLEYVHDAERFGNDIQVVINEDMDTRQRLFDDLSRMNAGVYSMYESSALEETYLKLIKESR